MNKKFIFIGATALTVILAITWKITIDNNAEKRVADFIQNVHLEDVLRYKNVSAGWLADSVTLHDVSVTTKNINDDEIKIQSMRVAISEADGDSIIPKKMSIDLVGLNIPIVDAIGKGEVKLSPTLLPTDQLARLGYTHVQGNLSFYFERDLKKHNLDVGMSFDFKDMNRAEFKVALNKVDLSQLEENLGGLTGLALLGSGSLRNFTLRYFQEISKVQLSSLQFSLKDKGFRDRTLLDMRERDMFFGSLKDFSKSGAETIRNEIKVATKGNKSESYRTYIKAIADFVEDGGSLKGKTDIEKPIPLFVRGELSNTFTELDVFAKQTGFRLNR